MLVHSQVYVVLGYKSGMIRIFNEVMLVFSIAAALSTDVMKLKELIVYLIIIYNRLASS